MKKSGIYETISKDPNNSRTTYEREQEDMDQNWIYVVSKC